jgi:hypothetical protein
VKTRVEQQTQELCEETQHLREVFSTGWDSESPR